MPSFILIRLTVCPQYANVTDRKTDRQTDTQRTDSIITIDQTTDVKTLFTIFIDGMFFKYVFIFQCFFMDALWNRADHYIFMLWFLYGRPA